MRAKFIGLACYAILAAACGSEAPTEPALPQPEPHFTYLRTGGPANGEANTIQPEVAQSGDPVWDGTNPAVSPPPGAALFCPAKITGFFQFSYAGKWFRMITTLTRLSFQDFGTHVMGTYKIPDQVLISSTDESMHLRGGRVRGSCTYVRFLPGLSVGNFHIYEYFGSWDEGPGFASSSGGGWASDFGTGDGNGWDDALDYFVSTGGGCPLGWDIWIDNVLVCDAR